MNLHIIVAIGGYNVVMVPGTDTAYGRFSAQMAFCPLYTLSFLSGEQLSM